MPDGEPEEGTDDGPAEAPARLIRWEGRGRTPPAGKLILTYGITIDGPIYRTVVYENGQFKRPDKKSFVTGLQYAKWLEIPPPDSGEALQLAPPEQPVGQLMISGWMPGGTFPRQPCDIVADFRVPGKSGAGESNLRRVCWFDGTDFLLSRHGSRIDAECVRWMALPLVEDDVSKSDTSGETL